MYAGSHRDWLGLMELPEVQLLANGWQVVTRVEWADACTAGRPQGVSYGLILQDESGERLLGFDNSHAYDGAPPKDPFDHEHRAGEVGRRYRYAFSDPWTLYEDFIGRCEDYCGRHGVTLELDL